MEPRPVSNSGMPSDPTRQEGAGQRAVTQERARPGGESSGLMPTASHRVFAYLNADKASLYRRILDVFTEAKSQFCLHLRTSELSARLDRSEEDEIATALQQLCGWGNLESIPDTAEVATVEEFYRPRFLYQLTTAGEAAQRAVSFFEESLQQPGELQAAALGDILAVLRDLAHLAEADPLDAGKIYLAFRTLRDRFEDLTSRAQTFMTSMQHPTDLHGLALEGFLGYKQMLIDYLERFIGELVVSTAAIASELLEIEGRGIERLVGACADRETVDALDPQSLVGASREQWRLRWRGLRSWFIGRPDQPSQSEILRARARSAIPALLNAIATMHERRATRSDRCSDLRTLARWFAQAPRAGDAHRLWRAAFGLAPCRHLFIDQATIEARDSRVAPSQTSWLETDPVRISLRLRQTGRYTRRGRITAIVDRTEEKRLLAALTAAELQQLEVARRRIATGQRCRLSDLHDLDASSFDLLLELLGEALAVRVLQGERADILSSDGTLRILLEPTEDGAQATIHTEHGRFTGSDHCVLIEDMSESLAP